MASKDANILKKHLKIQWLSVRDDRVATIKIRTNSSNVGLFPENAGKGPPVTYVSSCGKSVVDYICLSNCLRTSVNCIKVVDEHPCNLSHHLLLIVRVNAVFTVARET